MVTSAGLTTLWVGIGPGVGLLAHLVTTRFPGGGQEWPWCHMAGGGMGSGSDPPACMSLTKLAGGHGGAFWGGGRHWRKCPCHSPSSGESAAEMGCPTGFDLGGSKGSL